MVVIPTHRGAPERAWSRSGYRYTSARLAHLNPPERIPEGWGGRGPDGDGGEPLPYSA